MSPKDFACTFNTGTSIAAIANKQIYIVSAAAPFTALGQTFPLVSGQVLNFSSPFVVPTGAVSSATAGTVFYYIV